jgi:hypothetical protein
MPNAERTDRISARAYLHIFEERDDAPSVAAGASLFQMLRGGRLEHRGDCVGGSIKSLEVVRFEKFRDFGSARIELNLVQVLGEQAVVTTSWKQWKETSSSKTTKNRKPSASKGLLQRGPNHHFVFQRFFLHFWMGQGWGRANERRMASVSAFAPRWSPIQE